MKIIIPATESESISSNILGRLQAPTQKAIEMDTLARNAMKKRSCPNLPMLECDKDSMFRSANGSCNNLHRPYQVKFKKQKKNSTRLKYDPKKNIYGNGWC